MLGRLMKYEVRATARTLLPLYGVLLVFAIINRLFNQFDAFASTSFATGLVAGLTATVYSCVFVAVFVVTFIILIQRFYKNLLGDEGYLMHTLPVPTWQLIISKVIIAVMWSIISTMVAFLSTAIIGMDVDTLVRFFGDIGELLGTFTRQFGVNGYLVVLEILLMSLVGGIGGVLNIYASMSIGNLASKHKKLAAFGAFLALSWIFNFIFGLLISFFAEQESFINWVESNVKMGNIALLHGALWFIILCLFIYCVIHFVITSYILTHKLNLE